MMSKTSKDMRSKNANYAFSLWFRMVVLYVLMFLTTCVVPIVALFPGFGFPCLFTSLVDYTKIYSNQRNIVKHVTPTLFLESPEMFIYLGVTLSVDFFTAVYCVVAVIAVYKARVYIFGPTVLSQWLTVLGNTTLVFMGLLRLWMLQLFIHTLSFKHIHISAVLYMAHCGFSMVYVQFSISRMTDSWSLKLYGRNVPENTMLERIVLHYKPLMINLKLFVLSMEIMLMVLSVFLVVGNTFYVRVSDLVLGAINLYLTIVILWAFLTEVLYCDYMDCQYGFFIGAVASSVIMAFPVLRYETSFVSAAVYKMAVCNISLIPICACCFLVMRWTRIKRNTNIQYDPLEYNVGRPERRHKKVKFRKHEQDVLVLPSDDSDEELFERPTSLTT
ncbi:glycoprotein M [Vombatid gammaherpesvirus 1]|uniref:Glycoprotein M n=1 Tax=Vombatid gammaherpesvirus 1 TaxID=2052651 RepID=A0A3S8D7G4_9GAMA|nr:glycoprotein M [Vombatid gammaherpesvirus 1]AZB49137.1 glycoprotein M [Vombatid gammaherpesvirus 1]